MKKKFLKVARVLIGASLLALASSTVALAQENCRTIQDSKARLECFDKLSAAPAAKAAPKKSAKKSTDVIGGWQLKRHKDGLSDKLSCTIVPIGKPYIQVSDRDLYISYAGKGGVDGFRYRFDDGAISDMQLPTPIEKQIGAVHLHDAAFAKLLRSARLRVETLTLVAGIKNEDLNLSGMHKLFATMQQTCR